MTTDAALLRAIIANPDDDTPRLVYADWLDENGQPERAVAIRAHIAAHRINANASIVAGSVQFAPHQRTDRWNEWRRLMVTVTAVTSDPDVNGLSPFLAGLARVNLLDWSRGFVSAVQCEPGDWLAHGPGVVASHPVERVTILGMRPARAINHVVGFTYYPQPDDDPFEVGQHPRERYWSPTDPPHVLPFKLQDWTVRCRTKNVAESDDDCLDWLSRGCIAWAKEEAEKRRVAA
jgi:uncharacterized protein (TIGR02996 family)